MATELKEVQKATGAVMETTTAAAELSAAAPSSVTAQSSQTPQTPAQPASVMDTFLGVGSIVVQPLLSLLQYFGAISPSPTPVPVPRPKTIKEILEAFKKIEHPKKPTP